MKLRIQGNSLRIRVTRSDLDGLKRTGRIVETTAVGSGARFEYALEIGPGAELDASLGPSTIRVHLPRHLAEQWYDEREVGVRGTKSVGPGEDLVILIEKDFECLIPREDEDQTDHFPNPARA
jgi:Family of unknown function (DUF7009)